jgi:hypothetical protein|tara:strand:- start:16564 stop:16737 length:174 start_codon:yes stop_codon:yes gene_type:complete
MFPSAQVDKVLAEPDSQTAHGIRAKFFDAGHQTESSLMAKGIFRYTSQESADIAKDS